MSEIVQVTLKSPQHHVDAVYNGPPSQSSPGVDAVQMYGIEIPGQTRETFLIRATERSRSQSFRCHGTNGREELAESSVAHLDFPSEQQRRRGTVLRWHLAETVRSAGIVAHVVSVERGGALTPVPRAGSAALGGLEHDDQRPAGLSATASIWISRPRSCPANVS